jgi:hypothetical protein
VQIYSSTISAGHLPQKYESSSSFSSKMMASVALNIGRCRRKVFSTVVGKELSKYRKVNFGFHGADMVRQYYVTFLINTEFHIKLNETRVYQECC